MCKLLCIVKNWVVLYVVHLFGLSMLRAWVENQCRNSSESRHITNRPPLSILLQWSQITEPLKSQLGIQIFFEQRTRQR